MPDLQRAIEIATQAHAGQQRRNGDPYILHPLRVMFRVSGDAERVVAVMHDVVEDSSWTLEQLAAEGFGQEVLEAVSVLTKTKAADYDSYIKQIAGNPLARSVKMADLQDNLNALELPKVSDRDLSRIAKYHRAFNTLVGAEQS